MPEPERYLERWQSRNREPTDYENRLGDALEAAFADGISNLAALVDRLNAINIKAPQGRDWTQEAFQGEMRSLASDAAQTSFPGGWYHPSGRASHLAPLFGKERASLRRANAARRRRVIPEDVDALLAVGLRNKWYAICPSRFVTDRPVGLLRAGERLVLWREQHGTLYVQEDRCPHRGAPLSLARHLGDRLSCIYHGVEVLGDGRVAAVPAMPECKWVTKKLVKTYPAMEIKGAIFAYIGDSLHTAPVRFTPAEQITAGAYDAFLCYGEWKVPYRYVIDNVMDPMHGTYLHAASHSMARGEKQAKFVARKTEHGFVFEKEGQRDVNFDWVEWCDTGSLWMRLEIPYPQKSGPGGNFGIIAHCTPIDRETCAVFFWRFRKVQGWQRDVWRFLYKNRLEGRHWDVLEQDRQLLEALPYDADRREHLYQHDVGLTQVRRLLRREAQAQLEALATA